LGDGDESRGNLDHSKILRKKNTFSNEEVHTVLVTEER